MSGKGNQEVAGAKVLLSKSECIKGHSRHEGDTGSSEVQIALFTNRINRISGHVKQFPKDYSGRRGLLILIARRNSALKYLFRKSPEKYAEVCDSLGLRKKLVSA